MRSPFAALLTALLLWVGSTATAERFGALTRILPGSSLVALAPRHEGEPAGAKLTLILSQPVPWRLGAKTDPWQLLIDIAELDFTGLDVSSLPRGEALYAMKAAPLAPGWSRLSLELSGPMRVASAAMITAEGTAPARLELVLLPEAPDAFRAAASATVHEPQQPSDPGLAPPRPRQDGSRRLLVALDPGHGGLDPGAEREGYREADLMLTFALELEDTLIRAGFDTILTRRSDIFVPLEQRLTHARAQSADIFLSLHADTEVTGEAQGISVYTHEPAASETAAQKLAERHPSDDLLSGVDLSGQGDELARLLIALARTETQPRSERLAEALIQGFAETIGGLYRHPKLSADFAVLKAPDMPSVLIELGYLSAQGDRARLTSPDWRASAQAAIAAALGLWAEADAAEARLIRQ